MRKPIIFVGVAALAAIGLAWYFKRERNASSQETNRLSRELAAFQRPTGDGQRLAGVGLSSGVRDQTQAGKTGTGDVPAKPKSDPAVLARAHAYQKIVESVRYGALFRALGLSSTQIDQFLDNKLRSEADNVDVLTSLRAEGVAASDPGGQMLLKEVSDEYSAAQAALLGADAMTQVSQYERSMPAREYIDNLDGEATLEGAPLSPDQKATLTALIAQAMNPDSAGPSHSLGDLDWAAIDAEAHAFLSPAQFELFAGTEAPGPGNGVTSRFFEQMTSLIQAGARADSSAANH